MQTRLVHLQPFDEYPLVHHALERTYMVGTMVVVDLMLLTIGWAGRCVWTRN